MDIVVAQIYIILSVTTIFIFLLTRKVNFRIAKNEDLIFSIEFMFFKLEFTKKQGSFEVETKEKEIRGLFHNQNFISKLAKYPELFSNSLICGYLNIPELA